MTDYTRISVTGSTRRAELVVPSDEPLGTVLPQLIDLLDEPDGTVARPLTLVRPDGEPLDIAQSPVQQELRDGTALRLIRVDGSPPPPVVIDLTDAAAAELAARPDRWDDRARRAVGGTAVAAAVAVAGAVAPLTGSAVLLAAGLALVVLLGLALGFGLGGLRGLAAACTAGAAGAAVPIGLAAASLGGGALAGVAAGLLAASVVLAVGAGAAMRRSGPVAGGIIGAILAAILLVIPAFGLSSVDAAAVTIVVAVLILGLLPWIALSAAGLTGLDEAAAAGIAVPRARARASIDDAYSALTWGVAAAAAAVAISGIVLVADAGLWPRLLALAAVVAVALRTRSFPLRAQALQLWAAVLLIAVVGAVALATTTPWIVAGAATLVAAAAAGAALIEPRAHQRARLRSLGNAVETLAVVALLPLLLGAFGVYDELLALFRTGA